MISLYAAISKYLLIEVLRVEDCMTKDELEVANYNIQVMIINLEKVFIIYGLAIFLGCLVQTMIMHSTFLLLRQCAGGWHAKHSMSCTMFSVLIFDITPKLVLDYHFTLAAKPSFFLYAISICLITIVFQYAPADTEINPLVNLKTRKFKKLKSLIVIVLLLLVVLFKATGSIQLMMLLGISIECVLIHPIYYKIMRRRYNNYETYK